MASSPCLLFVAVVLLPLNLFTNHEQIILASSSQTRVNFLREHFKNVLVVRHKIKEEKIKNDYLFVHIRRNGSSMEAVDFNNILNTNVWIHIVLTINNSEMKLYVDGVLKDTNNSGHNLNYMTRANHWVGRSSYSSDQYFDGTMAFLRFWHGTLLSQENVTELYNTSSLFSVPTAD